MRSVHAGARAPNDRLESAHLAVRAAYSKRAGLKAVHPFPMQVSFKPTADGSDFKPQQVFLALQRVSDGAVAYAVGKASKKDAGYVIAAPATAIAAQIGKKVSYGFSAPAHPHVCPLALLRSQTPLTLQPCTQGNCSDRHCEAFSKDSKQHKALACRRPGWRDHVTVRALPYTGWRVPGVLVRG